MPATVPEAKPPKPSVSSHSDRSSTVIARPPRRADTRPLGFWTRTPSMSAGSRRLRMWRDRRPTAATPAAASAAVPAFPETLRESDLRASHSPRYLVLNLLGCDLHAPLAACRHRRRTYRQELHEILCEHQIERPIDR